ncbi:MAG: serine hydrolase [Planctomycetes bacterium]|nr:serine hydrolase [Planctomycetota bacterium]
MRCSVVASCVLAACATQPVPEPLVAPVADLTGYAERHQREHGMPGVWFGLMAVGQDGVEARWEAALGVRDPNGDVAASTSDRLPVASLSKPLTATVALQLCQNGLLSLDGVVPGFDGPEPTRLADLLAHRSGLPAWPIRGHPADLAEVPLAEVVLSLRGVAPAFPPGQGFGYSNAGYAMVGAMIERATAQPFAVAMRHWLLAPLGMSRSCFLRPAGLEVPNGRVVAPDGRIVTWPVACGGTAPAVGLHATIGDLLTFARTWLPAPPRAVLPPEWLRWQWTANGAASSGVGYGCFVDDFDGHRRIGHVGTGPGFAAEFAVLPDTGLAAVAVCSLDGSNAVARAIVERALRAMLAQRRGERLAAAVFPTSLGSEAARGLAGRYRRDDLWFDLRERAGELIFDPCNGVATRMRRLHDVLVSDDRFDLGNRTLRVLGEGRVHDGYQEFTRVTAPPAPPPPELVPLLGEYGPDHDVLFVYEDEGRLGAYLHWQARELLDADGADRWRMGPGAQAAHLHFERAADGAVVAAVLDGVRLARRPDPPRDGYRIEPVRPIAELRAEAATASPPPQPAGLRPAELVGLAELSPTLRFDIRYATANNFLGTPVYESANPRLQRPAAAALLRAHGALAAQGLGLCIFDAYRPWAVTKVFFDATPPAQRHFVADPAQGSRHNRGCAVDLTLYELATGAIVEMPSGFDEFTERAYPDWPGGTTRQRWHRELLRRAMEDSGFTVYEHEWWHFDFADWRQYPVLNET